jgi:hypothetical protein
MTVVDAARTLGFAFGIDAKERLHRLAPIPPPLFAVEQTIIKHYVLVIVVSDPRARWSDIIKSLYHGRLPQSRACD